MIKKLILTTFLVSVSGQMVIAQETAGRRSVPTLIVTSDPINKVVQEEKTTEPSSPVSPVIEARVQDMSDGLYSKPVRSEDISAERVLNPDYFEPVNTMTAQKIKNIQSEMYNLQSEIADAATQLQTLEIVGQDLAANYYAAVATISTQLQSGTTPGNPRLKSRLVLAEDALDTLSGNVADLNKMAVQVADLATVSSFLQQEARAAYGLSGSVEEDHVHLAQLEDSLSNTAVAINRLLNSVNDNITRAAAYMSSERSNLRTLALAISNGDLYGKSLANRPFSMAGSSDIVNEVAYSESMQAQNNSMLTPVPAQGQPTAAPAADIVSQPIVDQAPSRAAVMATSPSSPRPLIKIRFDRPDVDFTQALYMSINEAMEKYPDTQFELIAVSPGMGNPAKLAIESTRARRNAEEVLRDMVQMGVDTNKVKLANLTQDDIQYNEVHLYIR